MNIHEPDVLIKNKWPEWEWLGKRWVSNNLTWIRARHKVMGWKWFYCFEKDCFLDVDGYNIEITL